VGQHPPARRQHPDRPIVAELREHGAVIVEDVLDPALLARFNAELDPILEQVSPKRPYLNPMIDFFYGDPFRKGGGKGGGLVDAPGRRLGHPKGPYPPSSYPESTSSR
jgi:hypothetical protein